jgi:hypothetical protein
VKKTNVILSEAKNIGEGTKSTTLHPYILHGVYPERSVRVQDDDR